MTVRMKHLSLAILLGLANPAGAEQAKHHFDIPPQALGSALQTLATQSGAQMLYAEQLMAGKQSKGLNGDYTTSEAVEKLLEGSGFTPKVSESGTVTITPADNSSKLDPTTLPAVKVLGKAEYDVTDPYNEDYVLPNATAGTKTDTPTMETPLNVQVISKQVMKDQQVITLADSLKNVSGVTTMSQGSNGNFTGTNGGSNQVITLRGFADETFFRDGFRLQQGAASRNMANVEAVEVLKGSAAILYGLVEPGGMVNVVTKQPQATPYYAVNQQFGTYDLYRTTVDATGPVTSNKDLLYRMNISYQNNNSWQDYVGNEDIFLAPVLKWNISSKTQATVEFEYDRKHQGLGFGYNNYINGQFSHPPLSTNYGGYSPATTETFLGSMNWSHRFNDDWTIKNRFSANQQSYTGNTVLPSYTSTADGIGAATPFPYPDGLGVVQEKIGNTAQNNTYSTNLDLIGHFETIGLKHTLLVGGDYYRINNAFTFTAPGTGLYSIVNPFNPVNPGITADASWAPGTIGFGTKVDTDQYGLYAQDQIKLPYNIHVTGGLRYQNIHQKTINTTFGAPDTSGGVSSKDAVTPRVGILWHPLSWASLYANYAESFGANTGLIWSASGQYQVVAPTGASQYEGGIKTEFFGGRLFATLAYFDLTKTNIAVADNNLAHDCGSGPGQCFIAIGAVNSSGPELDIKGEILPGWNAIATWSYNDVVITKTDAQNSPLFVNGGGTYAVGQRLPYVPRNTASFWSTYELQDSNLKGLKFGGGVTVRDGQISNGVDHAGNTIISNTPGYATLGLMTAYSHAIGKTKVTVQFNIDNLLDKRYFTNTSGIYNSPGFYGGFASYGAPRTAMGSISIQY
jgi:iron complex outermembrane recepter protein